MQTVSLLVIRSPFGRIGLEGEEALTRLYLPGTLSAHAPVLGGDETPLLRQAREELEAYFRGRLRVFSVPTALSGTEFQRAVWAALREIPYGETRTYGELAAMLGRPGAVRAVGQANHYNPIPIFLPCHRVVGKGGKLTGYAGGLDMKRALLRLETGRGFS